MPTWLSIILALGGSTLISLIVSFIWNSIIKKVNKIKELEEKQIQQKYLEEESKRQIEWEKKVLEAIAPINEKMDLIRDDIEKNKIATVTSLRAEMMILKDKYIKRDFAAPEDKAAWNQLYKDYSSQGGNHFKEYVDAWKNQVNKLPENVAYKEYLKNYFDEYKMDEDGK